MVLYTEANKHSVQDNIHTIKNMTNASPHAFSNTIINARKMKSMWNVPPINDQETATQSPAIANSRTTHRIVACPGYSGHFAGKGKSVGKPEALVHTVLPLSSIDTEQLALEENQFVTSNSFYQKKTIVAKEIQDYNIRKKFFRTPPDEIPPLLSKGLPAIDQTNRSGYTNSASYSDSCTTNNSPTSCNSVHSVGNSPSRANSSPDNSISDRDLNQLVTVATMTDIDTLQPSTGYSGYYRGKVDGIVGKKQIFNNSISDAHCLASPSPKRNTVNNRNRFFEPIVGYDGHYTHKVNGKVGEVSVHKSSISTSEEHKWDGAKPDTITNNRSINNSAENYNNYVHDPTVGYTGCYVGKVDGKLTDHHTIPDNYDTTDLKTVPVSTFEIENSSHSNSNKINNSDGHSNITSEKYVSPIISKIRPVIREALPYKHELRHKLERMFLSVDNGKTGTCREVQVVQILKLFGVQLLPSEWKKLFNHYRVIDPKRRVEGSIGYDNIIEALVAN